MNSPESITSLPERPQDERRRREVNYLIAMSIRVICVILCLFVTGWWLVLPILGAIVLPWVAVVLASVTTQRPGMLNAPEQLAVGSISSPTVPRRPDRPNW
ncbi:DUF3099 domain-containing protein [Rhodoglobus vestalii]|uniref:DUF3099 domain-containing protein n=1 Tax=Rhodoglobus vestalii TaxID=193384 RepID=UPI00114FDBE2|nr:DUF3099 domain-containing protein [Rhodoglobus vestalii]